MGAAASLSNDIDLNQKYFWPQFGQNECNLVVRMKSADIEEAKLMQFLNAWRSPYQDQPNVYKLQSLSSWEELEPFNKIVQQFSNGRIKSAAPLVMLIVVSDQEQAYTINERFALRNWGMPLEFKVRVNNIDIVQDQSCARNGSYLAGLFFQGFEQMTSRIGLPNTQLYMHYLTQAVTKFAEMHGNGIIQGGVRIDLRNIAVTAADSSVRGGYATDVRFVDWSNSKDISMLLQPPQNNSFVSKYNSDIKESYAQDQVKAIISLFENQPPDIPSTVCDNFEDESWFEIVMFLVLVMYELELPEDMMDMLLDHYTNIRQQEAIKYAQSHTPFSIDAAPAAA